MKRGRRTALMVLAPIVSVATLMLGLRVGAGSAVRAASVFAAPPAKPAEPNGPAPVVLQILTYLEDRGVRETVAMPGLTVVARTAAAEARWTGASNPDGIAEATLALPGADLEHVAVEVLAAGEPEPLALGIVGLLPPPETPRWARDPGDEGDRAAARPTKRDGAIGIDLVVEGERLVVGFPTPVWGHVVGQGIDPSRVSIEVTPEPGLLAEPAPKIGCAGWFELAATAQTHAIGIVIAAKSDSGKAGTWIGALPVAPGAFFVDLPRFVPPGAPQEAVLVAPNPRTVVYAEVDDERGRAFAAALPVAIEPGDATPRARLTIPPLAAGLHWLVVSGEPRGAERLAGAAIARPFLVGEPSSHGEVKPGEACSIGPWLAQRPAMRFPRWLALDGMATRGAGNRARHRAGLFIGLVSLFAAAILEILLLTAASREARAALLLAELAELDGDEGQADRVTARAPGGGLVIGILIALLGFALLSALMIAKA